MYKLYSMPGTCSTAIHVLLNHLKQDVEIIDVRELPSYKNINTTGMVPMLDDNGMLIREGGAIVMHLLEKHKSDMIPTDEKAKAKFLEWLFFAYATMHPAYGKLFFSKNNLEGDAQITALKAGAANAEKLWKIVDDHLEETQYMLGDMPTIVDYLLVNFINWGAYFDVKIVFGKNVQRLINEVFALPEFKSAYESEGVEYFMAK